LSGSLDETARSVKTHRTVAPTIDAAAATREGPPLPPLHEAAFKTPGEVEFGRGFEALINGFVPNT
jgi:hypothetical protein